MEMEIEMNMEQPCIERKSHYYSIGKIDESSPSNYMDKKDIEDPYFWLRDESRSDPKIINYLEKENEYFKNFLVGTEEYQNKIVSLLKSYINENDTSYPSPNGKGQFESNYYYYTKTYEGKGYPEYWRRNQITKIDECVLDCNEIAVDKDYCDFMDVKFSYDNKYLIYGINLTGDEWYNIIIYDLEEKKEVEHSLHLVKSSVTMVRYSNNIYYIGCDEQTERFYQVWRYDFRTQEKQLIYQEDDVERGVGIGKDNKYIYVVSGSFNNIEYYYITLDEDGYEVGNMELLLSRKDNVKASIHSWRNSWIIISNKDDVKSHKLFIVSKDNPGIENWTKVECQTSLPETFLVKSSEKINESYNVDILDVTCSNDWICVNVGLEDLTLTYIIYRLGEQLDSNWILLNNMNNDLETMTISFSYHDSNKIWMIVSSPIKPSTLYQIDDITVFNTGTGTETETGTVAVNIEKYFIHLYTPETPNYNPELYTFKRMYIESYDGEWIPVSVSHHKDVKEDAPVYLYGYGAYGLTIPAQSLYTSRLMEDLGFIKVIVSVRGESMRGEKWYLGGKMKNKMNSFNDFIVASEYFKNYEGKTRKILAEGRSAGGLLMCGVYTMRPDLYDGVISGVPFVDVIATMSDPSIPLVTGEWNEWGNSNIETDYDVMIKYSPYDNLKMNVDYPSIFISSGLYDPRVQYWEPTKFMAKLRYCSADKEHHKYYLKTNMSKGHFSNTDRYEEMKEKSEEIIFGLWSVGLLKK
jgi:oligopeptidase B